ncbi:MAG: amino acid ABC transporter substrate-binding protein [Desulfobacteraceae bacterium]|nr:amino acid ABC transporter substrate-binding protein [Desulfobacteraceae bacterium]
MKRMITRNLVKEFFIICLLFSLSTDSLGAPVIKVRVNDMPPQYILENGKWKGFAIELMEALLNEAGCKAEYMKLPWARALLELEDGRIDAVMNVSYTSERAKKFYFIWATNYETGIIIVKKNSNYSIDSLDDFKRLPDKIGFERGNVYSDEFNEKFKNDKVFRDVFYAMSNSQMIPNMIQEEKFIGALGLLLNAQYQIKTDPRFTNLKVHPFQISKQPNFFAFSRKSVSKDLILKLHEANIRAIAKGSYGKIMRKWKE